MLVLMLAQYAGKMFKCVLYSLLFSVDLSLFNNIAGKLMLNSTSQYKQ